MTSAAAGITEGKPRKPNGPSQALTASSGCEASLMMPVPPAWVASTAFYNLVESDMPRSLRYKVELSPEQEQSLKAITTKGSHKARVMTRAQILLMAHRQLGDLAISEALGISVQMAQSIRKRFVLGGLDAALYDAPHTGRPAKFTGQDRAA
ncbi:helix-turn-helix domain-containing protein, partial [Deinococcus aquatilis]|uniref:helix-turn-helix domain-containing protein n=2 Tax=Deinococcus aquatilis TaxID=519440 RepID=UPI00146DADAA